MIVYSSPGVYIQEVPAGPQPISAAPTSVLAIVGTTQRGPVNEPTRVTGWAEYRATFGGLVEGLFTAEAVYGYFENGGPAVHVVRVDPSAAADWNVLEADGGAAFRIVAASPGTWANDLGVSVYPDFTAGGGRLYFSEITAAANLTAANTPKDVTVRSTAGLTVGQTVAIVFADTKSARVDPGAATVTAIDAAASKVTLTITAGGAFVAGSTYLSSTLAAGAGAVRLASGGGIRRGDLIRLTTPVRSTNTAARRATRTAIVESVTPAQPGLVLTVSGGPADAVPAVQFAQRVERFTGTVAAALGAPALPFASITGWAQSPAPAEGAILEGHLATAAGGLVGSWNVATKAFDFRGNVPAGPVEVEAVVVARPFEQTVDLAAPTHEQLTERFGFVPEGGQLKLTRSGADPAVTLTRAGSSWMPAAAVTGTVTKVEVVPPANPTTGLLVQCAVEPRTTDFLGLAAGSLAIASVDRISAGLYLVKTAENGTLGAGPWELRTFVPTEVTPQRFAIAVTEGGTPVETYTGLALHPDHPSYYFRDDQVNDVSARIRVTERAPGPISVANMPAFAVPGAVGTNATATAADLKAGFGHLERVTEPAMVICPDTVALSEIEQTDVIGSMVTHCEEFRRFAIVDPPSGEENQELANWRLRSVSSIHAAVYAPWVSILNLDAKSPKRVVEVPPSGFVAGVFARTDRDRGVHKAPANERVRGIVGLATDYTQRQQDLLNPAAVNLIRSFPGRGLRIWGARNATDDVQWRYVNVRRLFNLIEVSVERNTQWVVFEPNTASTWLRIRVSVENFLDSLWRSGALAGTAPEQAYRVRVGLGETMTETDIDNGLVVTEVAVAPAKPAEFVVFRFSHKRITE